MRPRSYLPLPDHDRLDRLANRQPQRRRFLATALASAAVIALPACETPNFDRNTTTWTFRRRYTGGGSGNRN
jgi:hypothetical protein